MAYVKVFDSLIHSTIWAEPLPTRVVWITMLAMADRDGVVKARAPGIAKAAGVTRPEAERALECFQSPDPDSTTKDYDGRRAVEHEDGWLILNYEKYRDRNDTDERKAKDAARQARKRERDKARQSRDCHVTSRLSRSVTPSDSDSDAGSSQAQTQQQLQAESAGARARENHMMDPEPARSDPRADVVWLNKLCAEVTGWTGSLLDGDRLERTASQLISLGHGCARDSGIEGRELIELVMRKWWTPKRMRIRGKPWIVMALQDWSETLHEVEQDEIRRQENAAKEAARAN